LARGAGGAEILKCINNPKVNGNPQNQRKTLKIKTPNFSGYSPTCATQKDAKEVTDYNYLIYVTSVLREDSTFPIVDDRHFFPRYPNYSFPGITAPHYPLTP